ncbi:GlxA family transcriptional regulator [Alloyangia pacifica]|nr:GlxA family transcriptional regulator [Alloyangia pacifica]
MKSVTLLLYDGFSNMVLSCLLEPLRAVRDQGAGGLSWQIVTPDDGPARSSSGLNISPDAAIADCDRCDLLIVVSGYGYREHARPERLAPLRRMTRGARAIVGADTGSWLLAAAGLLDDQGATIHWAVLAEFAEAFPQIQPSNARFVRGPRVSTCGGASTALELMLAIISEQFGPADAFLVSTMFVHDAERQQRSGRGANWLVGKGTARLRKIVNLMVETIENPLPLEDLAQRAGLTRRTLNRLFQAELAMSPGRYYQLMRLSHARELASGSDYDLREIALRCGYSNASALSKAFRLAFGHPIRKARAPRPRQRES